MSDERQKINPEEVLASLRDKRLPIAVDTPFAFRYDARTKALQIEAPSIPVLGSFLMGVRLDLTPEALQSLSRVLAMIEANPGRDIEGRLMPENVQ